MLNHEWTTGAEQERDEILLGLSLPQQERFELAFNKCLDQIKLFPESGPVAPFAVGREDIRQIVFAIVR